MLIHIKDETLTSLLLTVSPLLFLHAIQQRKISIPFLLSLSIKSFPFHLVFPACLFIFAVSAFFPGNKPVRLAFFRGKIFSSLPIFLSCPVLLDSDPCLSVPPHFLHLFLPIRSDSISLLHKNTFLFLSISRSWARDNSVFNVFRAQSCF